MFSQFSGRSEFNLKHCLSWCHPGARCQDFISTDVEPGLKLTYRGIEFPRKPTAWSTDWLWWLLWSNYHCRWSRLPEQDISVWGETGEAVTWWCWGGRGEAVPGPCPAPPSYQPPPCPCLSPSITTIAHRDCSATTPSSQHHQLSLVTGTQKEWCPCNMNCSCSTRYAYQGEMGQKGKIFGQILINFIGTFRIIFFLLNLIDTDHY